jgi:hypothetical protein
MIASEGCLDVAPAGRSRTSLPLRPIRELRLGHALGVAVLRASSQTGEVCLAEAAKRRTRTAPYRSWLTFSTCSADQARRRLRSLPRRSARDISISWSRWSSHLRARHHRGPPSSRRKSTASGCISRARMSGRPNAIAGCSTQTLNLDRIASITGSTSRRRQRRQIGCSPVARRRRHRLIAGRCSGRPTGNQSLRCSTDDQSV